MHKVCWFLLGISCLIGQRVLADIPPAKESLRSFSITLDTVVSAMLLESVNFQETAQVAILDGRCHVKQYIWNSKDKDRSGRNQTISCLESTRCLGKQIPSCTMSFVDDAAAWFHTIDQAEPLP